jgi:serine/threonine protein kinase
MCVSTPERDWNLIAGTQEEKEAWVNAIREHMRPRLKEGGLDQYELGKTVGIGTFGKVKAAVHVATGEQVAIKIIQKGKTDPQALQHEIELQGRLNHQHIVHVHEVFEQDSSTYIVMEFASGGHLFDYLAKHPRMSEDDARRIFQQVIAGVEHCHENHVAHRDLKLENILIDNAKNVKIGDFGVSGDIVENELLRDACGSPNYAAPELLYKDCAYEGPEVDVWSCGVILYALLCKNLPFYANSTPDLMRLIKKGKYNVPGYVSEQATDLLSKMLCVQVTKRITITGIRQHPWFTQDLPERLAKKIHEQVVDIIAEPMMLVKTPLSMSLGLWGVV